MEKADRRLNWKVDIKKDNENQKLIKEKWIYNLVKVIIEGPEVDILEKIKTVRSKNKEVIKKNEKNESKSIKEKQMVGRRRFSIEEKKSIYTEEWKVKSKDNPVAS